MNKLIKVLSIVIAGFILTANSFAADVTMRIYTITDEKSFGSKFTSF